MRPFARRMPRAARARASCSSLLQVSKVAGTASMPMNTGCSMTAIRYNLKSLAQQRNQEHPSSLATIVPPDNNRKPSFHVVGGKQRAHAARGHWWDAWWHPRSNLRSLKWRRKVGSPPMLQVAAPRNNDNPPLLLVAAPRNDPRPPHSSSAAPVTH